MKNKIIAAVVPVAAFAALAGTGFGSWYFASAGANATASASVAVTDAKSETGSLTIDASFPKVNGDIQGFYLGLDQNADPYWTTKNPKAEANKEQEGRDAIVKEMKVTYTAGSNVTSGSSDISVVKMNATWTTSDTNEKNDYAKYITVTPTDIKDADFDFNGGYTGTYIYKLPKVAWVEGAKPKTKKAYDAMVTAMSTVSFSVSFSTSIVE